MPFPNVATAPTENVFTHRFDEALRDAMEGQIATLATQHGFANARTATRHAAVKYLGLLHLRALATQTDGAKACRELCIDAFRRTAEQPEGRTINAAQFRGGKANKGCRNHEAALNMARVTHLGARLKSRSKRNLVFLLIGCEHGHKVTPPPDDSWVD